VKVNPSHVTVIVLGILVLGLLFQLNSLNVKNRRLEEELDYTRKELELLNQTYCTALEGVLGKIDLELLAKITDSFEEDRSVYPITIMCLKELGETEIAKLNLLGIGFVKVNETIVSEGENYLATGTFSSIIKASEKDFVSKIKHGYDVGLSLFFSGEILETAFAVFPEDAEITVSPESPSEGDLVEICVTNMHETKNMAFTFNLYIDEETESNLVFSSAEGFDGGYRPAYTILKPGAMYKIQLSVKAAGEYFIGSGNLSFNVLASAE
jgi:hypothetical protein